MLGITAAGVAITLTAASRAIFTELFWTPAALLQAEDRCHRIGQTAAVKIDYIVASNSVDDILWPLVEAKMRVLGEIVEGRTDVQMSFESGEVQELDSLVEELAREDVDFNPAETAEDDDEEEDGPMVRRSKSESASGGSYSDSHAWSGAGVDSSGWGKPEEIHCDYPGTLMRVASAPPSSSFVSLEQRQMEEIRLRLGIGGRHASLQPSLASQKHGTQGAFATSTEQLQRLRQQQLEQLAMLSKQRQTIQHPPAQHHIKQPFEQFVPSQQGSPVVHEVHESPRTSPQLAQTNLELPRDLPEPSFAQLQADFLQPHSNEDDIDFDELFIMGTAGSSSASS